MIKLVKTIKALCLLILTSLVICGCDRKTSSQKQQENLTEFKITTTPSGANLYYEGKKIGISPIARSGVAPGAKLIKLQKEGYKTKWINLIAENNKKIDVNEKLEPITASVLITSQPSRASVKMNGAVIGETPIVLHEQKIGDHSAELHVLGHLQKTVSWAITNERPKSIKVNLESNEGIVNINSEPSKAMVYIDNKPYGLTPLHKEISEGEYTIRIERRGFIDYEQNLSIRRGETKKIFSELIIKPSSITVTTVPPNAEVFINGDAYSNSPTTLSNLTPGEYEIVVRKDGYDNSIRDISLAPGQDANVEITLDTNLGGADIVANPPGVTIYLDGKKIGVTEAGGDKKLSKVFEVRNITSGKHKLEFSHKRATPPSKTITFDVKKGEIERVRPVTMWIADHILTLTNGRRITGKLMFQNDEEVMFSDMPSVTQGYKREEVRSLTPLQIQE